MELKNFNNRQFESFSELLEKSRQEMPASPDFRGRIRLELEKIQQNKGEERTWRDILLELAALPSFKVGFATALVALCLTSYLELSLPEPKPQPPIPSFLIDRLFTE
jgi:hypothetical protein